MRFITKTIHNDKFVKTFNNIIFYIVRIILTLPIISLILSFAYTIRYSTIRSEWLRTVIIFFMLIGLLIWGILLLKYIIPAISNKINEKKNKRRKEIENILSEIKKKNEEFNSIKTVDELCNYIDKNY